MEAQTKSIATPMHDFVTLPALPLDQIICGDNCEVMLTLPSESIDLAVTSPPYDDLRTYGGHDWDFYGVAWNLKRLLKPGGVIVWVVGDATKDGSESLNSFRQADRFSEMGFAIETMIYGKNSSNPNVSQPRYMQSFEFMFVLVKGQRARVFNPIMAKNALAGKQRKPSSKMQRNGEHKTYGANSASEYAEEGILSNIWIYNTGNATGDDIIAFKHPAPFPEALARDHILSWSNEGDVVLDPFSGSGTTAKMAKHNGRRFIGIEVNPEYVEISQQRLAQGVLF